MKWLSLLMVLTLATACGGLLGPGDDSGDDDDDSSPTATPTGSPTPTPAPVEYGGAVSFGVSRIEVAGGSPQVSGFASATFFVPHQPEGTPESLPGLDECVVNGPGTGGGGTSPTYRDAGSQVMLDGPTTVSLDRAYNGAMIYYTPSAQPLPESAVSEGGSYDVTWSGSGEMQAGTLSGVLLVPDAVLMTQPASFSVPVSLSGSLTIQWTPPSSTGSDRVWIMVTTVDPDDSSNYASALCEASDDGSFTVPSGIIDQLPSGVGNMGIQRYILNEPELPDGSVLTASGVTQHFGPVEKP